MILLELFQFYVDIRNVFFRQMQGGKIRILACILTNLQIRWQDKVSVLYFDKLTNTRWQDKDSGLYLDKLANARWQNKIRLIF